MNRSEAGQPDHRAAPDPARAVAEPTLHRSGAVARMLRMPVATLRVWERRYGLSRPALSPSGQRLYSADDVRRLALLKQLTDLGHAIGRLAPLDMAQLQGVAATHAAALAATQRAPGAGAGRSDLPRPWRLAVVGQALATRLQRPAVRRHLGPPPVLLGPFADLEQAAAAWQAGAVDTVLVHAPQLPPGWPAWAQATAPALAGARMAVLYGFAADAECEALAAAGTAVLREPQPDAVLAQWLQTLRAMAAEPSPSMIGPAPAGDGSPPAPRRWDDAALADFAGLSSTIACECPRHVAELLMQLSHFEDYSAQCQQRSRADAQIHAYLKNVAATARAQFERALERVAQHEGLLLPDGRPQQT